MLRLACRSWRDNRICARASCLFAALRQGEGAVHGVPELGHGIAQILPLLRGAIHDRHLLFLLQGVVEIGADALKLGRPRGERIRLVVVEHVAHGERQQIQVILDAQQLQGIFTVAIDQIVLQFADAGNLPRDIAGISHHGGQSDHETQNKGRSRRPDSRCGARHEARIQRGREKFQRRRDIRRAQPTIFGSPMIATENKSF